jgi:S1-C subfamily serine protease
MRCLLAILLLTSTAAADVTGIMFTADYCQPCRSLRPSLSRLQRDYDVRKIDTSRDRATCRKYDITSIPQIVFLDDGVEIDRIQGASSDWQRRCEDRLSGRNNWRPIRAAVRVRTPGGMGSGVILSSVPGRTVIATAAHMVRDKSAQVSVDVFGDGGRVKTYPATVVSSNDTTDLALVLVVANTFPLPSVIGANDTPGQGDVAFGIGCSGGGRVSVMKCRVLRIENGDVFASGAPAQGRSGGGLYNSRFELIGICSAAGENDGWYVGAEKLKALLSEWKPTQYRSGFGVGLGIGIGCVSGPCRNPNCRRCYPPRIPTPISRSVPGPPGRPGATGPRGPAGSDATVDLSPLIRRIEALEKMKRPVVLIDGASGEIIDREEYTPGEAILFDVQALKVK